MSPEFFCLIESISALRGSPFFSTIALTPILRQINYFGFKGDQFTYWSCVRVAKPFSTGAGVPSPSCGGSPTAMIVEIRVRDGIVDFLMKLSKIEIRANEKSCLGS